MTAIIPKILIHLALSGLCSVKQLNTAEVWKALQEVDFFSDWWKEQMVKQCSF